MSKEFIYIVNGKEKSTFHRFDRLIPEKLYDYSYNTNIAREIFFIETWRDIRDYIKNPTVYRAIRISGVLRQLFIERRKGVNISLLSQVNRNYNVNIKYYCNNKILKGKPYPLFERQDESYVKDIRNLKFSDLDWSHQNQIKISVDGIPEIVDTSILDENEFLNKVCISFGQRNNPAFSVGNIIFLMANFNGGIHFDETPSFDELEAFHLADVNPLIPNKHNLFIEKINEISKVVLHALRPLIFEVASNLHKFVKSNIQSRGSSNVKLINNHKNTTNNK